MPTQHLATTDAVIVGVPMMDATEARQIVKNINRRLDQSRQELLELYDREGWRALGYGSWGACVKAEFEESSSALYRQLTAAKIERELFGDSRIGNPLPASQLEAVAKAAPEDRTKVIARADQLAGDAPRTARHIQQAFLEIAPPDPTPAGWACEQCGVIVTDMRRPLTPICSTCAIRRQTERVRTAPPPAVPPRPRRPVSADVSAQVAYIGQLEIYASALEVFIMELQKRFA
jgi:hypothetical protein